MTITTEILDTKIEIKSPFNAVEFLRVQVVSDDGVEVGRINLPRYVLMPDSDLSNESDSMKALCGVLHSTEIKKAYSSFLADQEE